VALAVVCWLLGLWLLVRKWQGVDVAVFEADTYAQGIRHSLHLGRAWPWDLTGRFWPFLLMAPAVYLHLPLLAPLPGGLPPLVLQALAVGAAAWLLAALARDAGAGPRVAAGLALAFLVHPVTGVAMAWGWSPYVSGAPLLVGGILALRTGRRRVGVALLLLAGATKVDAALMVAGLGVWAWLSPWRTGLGPSRLGRNLALAALAWTGLVGGLFAWSTWCAGTLAQDINLAGKDPPTAGGLWTVALALLPALPLLGRRSLLLVALAVGVEVDYTLFVNPANSGLVAAVALVLAAGALDLPRLARPGLRVGMAVLLGLLAQQLYQPPRVSPLPLTWAGLRYRPDPRGAVQRAWVRALPADAWLLTLEPASGAVGPHPGRVLAPWEWDGRTQVSVLLPAEEALREGLADCTQELVPVSSRGPAIRAGSCGDIGRDPTWRAVPALECLDGVELDRP